MKYIFKKYEFESQELAETRIAALPHTEVDGESHPSHSHTVVKLGYIFTEQPTFDEEGEIITPPTACARGTITFSPWNAAAGSTFDISLEGFSANETLHACWYYPSGSLVNCTDLEVDENGRRDTVYWSESDEPSGVYRMEVEGECVTVSTEWTID